jgi:hypothetical protein
MGTLVFVCPATGDEVSTGIGMEVETFESLKMETVRCPHCLQVHRLADIQARLAQSKNGELSSNKAA